MTVPSGMLLIRQISLLGLPITGLVYLSLFRKRMRRFLQAINRQIRNLSSNFEGETRQICGEATNVNLSKR
jgi:hypothetical protein